MRIVKDLFIFHLGACHHMKTHRPKQAWARPGAVKQSAHRHKDNAGPTAVQQTRAGQVLKKPKQHRPGQGPDKSQYGAGQPALLHYQSQSLFEVASVIAARIRAVHNSSEHPPLNSKRWLRRTMFTIEPCFDIYKMTAVHFSEALCFQCCIFLKVPSLVCPPQ